MFQMAAFARAMNRVPWQLSAAIGWTGMIIIPTAVEVHERESPTSAAAHENSASTSKLQSLSQEKIATLKLKGYVVIDEVLSETELALARADCAELRKLGAFMPTDQHDATIRSDSVHWVEESDKLGSLATLPGLLVVLRRLRGQALPLEMNDFSGFDALAPRRVDLGVTRGGQLACYNAPSLATEESAEDDAVVRSTNGARYCAHRDGVGVGTGNPLAAMLLPAVSMREATCILYLTAPADWSCDVACGVDEAPRLVGSADECRGGSLILFLGAEPDDTSGATATSILEILPIGGRLVVFVREPASTPLVRLRLVSGLLAAPCLTAMLRCASSFDTGSKTRSFHPARTTGQPHHPSRGEAAHTA